MKRTVWVGIVLVASVATVIALSRDGGETLTAPGRM